MKRYIIIAILLLSLFSFMLCNALNSSSGYNILYNTPVNSNNSWMPDYYQESIVLKSYFDNNIIIKDYDYTTTFKVAFCQQPMSSASTISRKIDDMEWALTNMANEAIANNSDMIIFSETAFCTYDCVPRPVLAEEIPSIDPDESPVYCLLTQYAEENNVWIYYGDYVKSDDPNKPYNSGIMIQPDGELGFVYNKHYGSNSESDCSLFGESSYTFDIDHPLGKIGCLICKDFHAGGAIDIKNSDFNFMLGIAGDGGGRSGNHYDLLMKEIITSDLIKSNGGVWVNYAEGGGSFFMDEFGNILENVNCGGTMIRYHDYSIPNNENDSIPPIRSNSSPSGTITLNTTRITLSIETDEIATCKYMTNPGINYTEMAYILNNTNSTNHSTLVTDLKYGMTYTYCIKCCDTSGNYNTDDFNITFDTGICGDTNNDSNVNSTDILLLVTYTFYPEGIQINELTVDVDGNDCNNILDTRLLMKHIVNETKYPLICK